MSVPRRSLNRYACWPWSHQWTKWTDISAGNVTCEYGNDPRKFITGTFIVQERRCEVCNKVQRRTERSGIAA